MNSAPFHYEVMAGVLEVMSDYASEAVVYMHEAELDPKHPEHWGNGLADYLELERWRVQERPLDLADMRRHDVMFFISPEFNVPYIKDLLHVVRPSSIIAMVHEAHSPGVFELARLYPNMRLVALSPHIVQALDEQNVTADWWLAVRQLHPRLRAQERCETVGTKKLRPGCLDGFSLQGMIDPTRRNYTVLWEEVASYYGLQLPAAAPSDGAAGSQSGGGGSGSDNWQGDVGNKNANLETSGQDEKKATATVNAENAKAVSSGSSSDTTAAGDQHSGTTSDASSSSSSSSSSSTTEAAGSGASSSSGSTAKAMDTSGTTAKVTVTGASGAGAITATYSWDSQPDSSSNHDRNHDRFQVIGLPETGATGGGAQAAGTRRAHRRLLNAQHGQRSMHAAGKKPVKIKIIGQTVFWSSVEVPSVLRDYVALYISLPYAAYYRQVYHSNALLTFFATDTYYKSKISSTLVTSLITGVPMLVPQRFLDAYTFLNTSHVVLQAPDERNIHAMARLLAEPEEEQVARRDNVRLLAEDLNARAAAYVRSIAGPARSAPAGSNAEVAAAQAAASGACWAPS